MQIGAVAGASDKNAGKDAGARRFFHYVGDGVGGRFQKIGIAPGQRDRLRQSGDGLLGHVAGKRHIDRTAVIQGFGDEAFGLQRGIVWRHHRAGYDGGLAHALKQSVLAVAQGVMNNGTRALHANAGGADEMKNRQVFGVGPGDAGERG